MGAAYGYNLVIGIPVLMQVVNICYPNMTAAIEPMPLEVSYHGNPIALRVSFSSARFSAGYEVEAEETP